MDTTMPVPQYEPDEIALDIPAAYTYLNVISGCIAAAFERLEDLQDRKTLAYQVQLAVHETCTNIVEHAYAGKYGRIQVVLSLPVKAGQLVIVIQDQGKSFQFSGYTQPNLDEPQESGYGLVLIRQLMDEVTYQALPGVNQWRLVKHLQQRT
jgi:serine/threonine-protein kinase RsbW